MSPLSEAQVERIARELAGRMGGSAPLARSRTSPAGYVARMALTPQAPVPEPVGARLGDGVFATVDDCIEAATIAFANLSAATLEKRREIIAAVRAAMREHGEELARHAHTETGLGRFEHKVLKNRLVAEKTPGPEDLVPETVTGDHGLTLTEWAPFGVIGAITPTTNPTSTIICNTIGMVSAGNSVVFNVHPGATECSMATIRLLNRAITGAGGPQNLITAVARPTIGSATELMHHGGINLLVVTGGPGVVKAAMQSGKRSVSAGPGNPPAVVDATADIAKAARDLVHGAGFDNNIICVDEKEVLVVDSVADKLKDVMRRSGAVEIPKSELSRLEKVIFSKGAGPRGHATMNRDLVGKNAEEILKAMGMPGGREVRCLIVDVPVDHPLVWTEQMMPVLPISRVSNTDEAIDLAVQVEGGCFHTASMHSRDIEKLSRMARVSNASIFVKNGPNYTGLGNGGEGYTSFTIASPTGEGLTGPREFSRWRRCVVVDQLRVV